MIDANGNATATAFKYDALGREIERRNAPGDVWSFAYDSRDNMVLTTDAKNQTIEKTFDVMSRLTRILLIRADGSTGDDQTFAYDAIFLRTRLRKTGGARRRWPTTSIPASPGPTTGPTGWPRRRCMGASAMRSRRPC